jgi:hypothetical protein
MCLHVGHACTTGAANDVGDHQAANTYGIDDAYNIINML